ncbi:MAG: insulinase family protein [Parachlamydiales bacterium]
MIEEACELTYKTPSMAQIETRKIRLDNGLEACLISDPGVEESGVAIAVETGSWQDPKEASGMAHFTEHMLFLGNARYPEENGFRRLLDAHNGKANAFTADQFTCYMFTIESDHLEEALDPFAHFFIDPLFSADAMVRERVAVDQEFERAKEHDGWREEMVRKAVANPHHPHADFGFGSRETLGSLTPEAMRLWFESHYSSNLMHLLVYSPLPLDTLQEQVVESFSQIPNREIGPFPTPGTKHSPKTAGKLLAVKPHKAMRNLTLGWELPYDDRAERETAAARFAAYLLGHEGEGSLGARLKQQGLIEGIATQLDVYRKPHSPTYTLFLSLDLTERGLQERDLVIGQLFAAINSYQENPPPQSLFEEMQTVRRLGYEYSSRSDLFTLMRIHAPHLAAEPIAAYPSELLLAKRFDSQRITTLFSELTPERTHFTLAADPKEMGIKMNKAEPHMGARYALLPIDQARLAEWASLSGEPPLPHPNPYLPEDLSLTPVPQLEEPLPLSDNDYGRLYYAADPNLSVPEVSWLLAIRSPAAPPGDPRAAALLDLLLASAQHTLNEEAYPAKQGGLSYLLKPIEEGVQLSLDGFRDKAPLLLSRLLETLKSTLPTGEDFATLKSALQRSYDNLQKEGTLLQAAELLKSLLIEGYVTAAEKGEALREITRADLAQFQRAFLQKTYIQGILFGNFTPEEAQGVAYEIRAFQTEPYPEGWCRKARVATLPDQGPYMVTKRSPSRGATAILTLQESPFSAENRSVQQILSAALEEPFFTTLRTQQQTGYVVWSWDEDLERHLFQSFLVQSSTHDGRDLIARYEAFIEEFTRALKTGALSPDRFDTLKSSLIAKLQRAPKNPKEAAARLFTCAFDFDDFRWMERRADATRALTYETFRARALEWLGPENKRRLGVILEGKLPPDALHYKTVTSPQKWRSLSEYEGGLPKPDDLGSERRPRKADRCCCHK